MCRGLRLTPFLDLGFTAPADQFLRKEQLGEPEISYPLEVVLCEGCGLFQLSHVVSPEILYRHDYPYEASITRTGRLHWAEFARSTVERFQLGAQDLVVDIGSNVGVLLDSFKTCGVKTLGVDPAGNIVRLAEKNGIETLCEFFSNDVAREIVRTKGHASVITATNVFAHIDDLEDLMTAVKTLLKKGGIFIFEAPYVVNLITSLQYDTIYHEHLSYLSVKPLKQFLAKFALEVFDIHERDIHGGSFRVFVAEAGRQAISPEVAEFLEREERMKLYDLKTLGTFAKAVEQNRQDLLWLLRSLKKEGKKIAAVSAPAKGMTLLNYCRIGTETLDFVTEKSTLKIGRFTPGTHLPVLPDEALAERRIDVALLLAWNFAEEIMKNLESYRKNGGKFIIPIPSPKVV